MTGHTEADSGLQQSKPSPNFPLFRHRNGQWAKKINKKLVYFGTDPQAALKAFERHLAGKPKLKRQRRRKVDDKPYPDFPLFKHPNGQWCKKIDGDPNYYGTDPDEALALYRDELENGPRSKRPGLTVEELCDRFLTSKKRKMETHDLTSRTFMEYYATCEGLVKQFGRNKVVDSITVDDFEQFRVELAKGRGPVTLANEIQRVRTVFKYGFDATLLDRPVRFGPDFKKPNKKKMRAARNKSGGKMFEPGELVKLIAAAKPAMKAMIYLGLNCGFGQTDVSSLPLDAPDLDAGWVDFPRPKTEMPRRSKLWPETVAALRQALAIRPNPKREDDAGLFFITKYGARWVKFNMHESEKDGATEYRATPTDSVGLEFNKLLNVLDLKRRGLGFYALRHTFRTVADRTLDARAVDYIMGHADDENDMGARYIEDIGDDRLEKVANAVRDWLKTGEKKPTDGQAPATIPFKQAAVS